jgi:hypothetical protein
VAGPSTWRKASEQAHSFTFRAPVTIIVSEFVGVVGLVTKARLEQQGFVRNHFLGRPIT